MIKSTYILDIFDLIFDEYESAELIKKQIPLIKEESREHTGIGLFINFKGCEEIENYKTPTLKFPVFDTDGNPIKRLNGVEIKNDALDILADITVHLRNGLIDSIEIFNKNGSEYRQINPVNYEMTQLWLDKSKRRTITR